MKNPVEIVHEETGRRTTVPARSVKALEKQGWRRAAVEVTDFGEAEPSYVTGSFGGCAEESIRNLPQGSYDEGGHLPQGWSLSSTDLPPLDES